MANKTYQIYRKPKDGQVTREHTLSEEQFSVLIRAVYDYKTVCSDANHRKIAEELFKTLSLVW